MQHVPPPAAPADASDGASDSGGMVCEVCFDGTDGDNNPILVCDGPHPTEVGKCTFAMHKNCCNHPRASCIGVNCWCPQHWSRSQAGDIKLEPDATHLAVQAGRNIQAATQPAARAARLQARTVTAPAASGGCNMSWQERAKILVKRCLEKGADMPALMSDAVWSTHDGKKIIDRLIQELNKLQPRKKTGMKRMRATSLRQA